MTELKKGDTIKVNRYGYEKNAVITKKWANGNMDVRLENGDYWLAQPSDVVEMTEKEKFKAWFNQYHSNNEAYSEQIAWDAWQASAKREGFVLVPKEPTDKMVAHMINTPIDVNLLCDHADTFLSESEAYIAYKAMLSAVEEK